MVSPVQPFLTSQDLVGNDSFGMPFILPFSRAFFSFKADYNTGYMHSSFFNAYWFNGNDWLITHSSIPVANTLILMFALQILTVLVGVGTLFVKPRLRVIPLILCVAIILLMILIRFSLDTGFTFSLQRHGIIPRYYVNFSGGFWLILISTLYFLISTELTKGRKHQNSRQSRLEAIKLYSN
jgi:hypothetical protein